MSNMPSKPLDIELAEQVIHAAPEDLAVFCSTFREVDATGNLLQVWKADPEARTVCMRIYMAVADKVADAAYQRVVDLSGSFPNGMKRSYIGYGYEPEFSNFSKGRAIVMGIACNAVLNRIEALWENMVASA